MISKVTPSAENVYKINGVETLIAPTTIQWVSHNVGTQGDNKPLTSAYWDVHLQFAEGNLQSEVEEWLLHAYTNSYATLSIPGRYSLDFVDISNVSFEVQGQPVLDSVVLGGFTLIVKGVLLV